MKYAWIDAQRGAFDLSELCRVLGVSISGYRAWQRGGTRRRQCLSDAQLLALIEAIHAEVKVPVEAKRVQLCVETGDASQKRPISL